MLCKDGITARYILAFCFFLVSAAELVSGTVAMICGILGVVELSTALLKFSPIIELFKKKD